MKPCSNLRQVSHIQRPSVSHRFHTAAALDSAELSARVVLNRLHADEGEQISISRTNRGVNVKGVVDTDERKREIATRLSAVPYVTYRRA